MDQTHFNDIAAFQPGVPVNFQPGVPAQQKVSPMHDAIRSMDAEIELLMTAVESHVKSISVVLNPNGAGTDEEQAVPSEARSELVSVVRDQARKIRDTRYYLMSITDRIEL